ncbi:MAG: L-serine ammonia-lyase [Bacteroidetes bacterium]|nr:L-serine ammonia-lyase [Bacteroidota bacterium]
MKKEPITTSIFELFKVGPGPSSSHTIGPMKAAKSFLDICNSLPTETISSAKSIDVNLYGSLSATGKGHGTDRAVLAGLLNWTPETTDPKEFLNLLIDQNINYKIQIGEKTIQFNSSNIHFHKGKFDFPHPNTLTFQIKNENNLLHEEEYYSIGGGFIIRKGDSTEQNQKSPKYPYSSMEDVKGILEKEKISLIELILENEKSISGLSEVEINQKMDSILQFMHSAVERGIIEDGVLPGSIKLHRKAKYLYSQAVEHKNKQEGFLMFLNAYCEAASEENAAGHIVVTAPTSGASGVIPGITYLLKKHFEYDQKNIREGMMVAALIGFLVKHNASISGAEMGCMGEIGTASAMSASMLSYCAGHSVNVIEAAAEIAIEHHLGMTCDPIGGYVQIPCIERNAMGSVKAYNAYLLACSGNQAYQKISLDSVIKVMKATGDDMSKKYKETSEAGLALSATEC